ncbi:MAG: DUF5106 domain-containing protein [Bacteroidales bacterium]
MKALGRILFSSVSLFFFLIGAGAQSFVFPDIPSSLTEPQERAEYLSYHYWDNFDFSDETNIKDRNIITEQAFSDFLSILPITSCPEEGISRLLDGASADSSMFAYFRGLSEKYLYDYESPVRNEELYIPFINYFLASDKLDDASKLLPEYQLRTVMKNRVGTIAADFEYESSDGKSSRLSKLKSDYVVLFFNNPGCHDCEQAEEAMCSSSALQRGGVTVLAIYTGDDRALWAASDYPAFMVSAYDKKQVIIGEGLYDLKHFPTLYLLDKNRKVILKDASVGAIDSWLREVAQPLPKAR